MPACVYTLWLSSTQCSRGCQGDNAADSSGTLRLRSTGLKPVKCMQGPIVYISNNSWHIHKSYCRSCTNAADSSGTLTNQCHVCVFRGVQHSCDIIFEKRGSLVISVYWILQALCQMLRSINWSLYPLSPPHSYTHTHTPGRTQKCHVGTWRGSQDGVPTSEGDARIWRQLLHATQRRDCDHQNHTHHPCRHVPPAL